MIKVACAVAAVLAPVIAAEGDSRFEFSDRVRLVNCEPATLVPCFRVKLNMVDAHGNPASPAFPASADLAKSVRIVVDGAPVEPFYVTATQGGHAPRVTGRVAMLVMDVSGSMTQPAGGGQSRFEAAKAAALEFLNSFQQGVDRVVVVPFASRNVETTIRNAKFATTLDEARRQVAALPSPQPNANTALYSAVDVALDAVTAEARRSEGSPETLLVVMTDGKNDIRRGDDPGLLEGEEGLNAASAKVRNSGIQVITVGLGDPGALDETALRRLGTYTYMVQNAADLKRVFTVARSLLVDRITATISSPYGDRASLAGRSLRFAAVMTLPDGVKIESLETVWSAPQMAAPSFEGKCESPEMKALVARKDVERTTNVAVLRPIFVFVGIGAVLLVLWFGLPRLIWSQRYERDFPSAPAHRWAATAGQGSSVESGRKAPPGFGGRGAPERRPNDATVYQPRTDSGTRTRLN